MITWVKCLLFHKGILTTGWQVAGKQRCTDLVGDFRNDHRVLIADKSNTISVMGHLTLGVSGEETFPRVRTVLNTVSPHRYISCVCFLFLL